MAESLKLFVDADACPVKKEVYRVADRFKLKTILVLDAGGTNLVFNAVRDGHILDKSFTLPAMSENLENLLEKIIHGFREINNQTGGNADAISFCFPGPADFENGIIGGAIPREYIRPAEAGIRESLSSGVLAGYPIVDVKATLYDGSYHDVDSSEMAFKIAGSMAIKDAVAQGGELVCGGGVHNHDLIRRLRASLPGTNIASTAIAGLDPDWVEAAAFGWLAARTLDGLPGNLPAVTGAAHPVILGAIYAGS